MLIMLAVFFFKKIMKIVLVMANYATNCASTICQSLLALTSVLGLFGVHCTTFLYICA